MTEDIIVQISLSLVQNLVYDIQSDQIFSHPTIKIISNEEAFL